MSVIWVENFQGEDFATDEAGMKKYEWLDGDPQTLSASPAFTGGNYLVMQANDDFLFTFTDAQSSSVSVITFGFLFRIPTIATATVGLVGFIASNSNTIQGEIRAFHDTGQLYVTRGANTQLGRTSQSVWKYSVWHELEVQYECSNNASTGCTIWLDGELVLQLAGGFDTQDSAGDDSVRKLWFFHGGVEYDHFYVVDNLGAFASNVGQPRVYTLWPNADGDSINYDSVGGGTLSISALASAVPDGDTTYLHASVLDTLDTWTFSALSAAGASETVTVQIVQFNAVVRRSDTTSDQEIELIYDDGTTCGNCSVSAFLDNAFSYAVVAYSAPPGGGVWEVSDVEKVSFGIALTKVA